MTKYSDRMDYTSIFGYNNNGRLQFRSVMLIMSQVEEVKHHMTEILAQLIHKFIKLDIDPNDRQDSEWFLAEWLISQEFGANPTDIINCVIKCVLAKACHFLLQTSEEFPSPGQTLIGNGRKKFQLKESFIDYLHEMGARTPAALVRLLLFATNDRNPVKISLVDAEMCLGEGLREIFERKKGDISAHSL